MAVLPLHIAQPLGVNVQFPVPPAGGTRVLINPCNWGALYIHIRVRGLTVASSIICGL